MRVDGGLAIVQGPMGSGKTLFEVRSGVAHMIAGGWWVTNIPLYDDALDRVARHVAPLNDRKRRAVRAALTERYRYVDDLEVALCHAVARERRKPGHALLRIGWDETLADLNAREWNGGRGKTADDRNELFERVPMLRKNGAAAYLLVQHGELIDKNARRICNWVISLQNQREGTRVFGLRMKFLPPLFLAYWYQANKAAKGAGPLQPVKVERYPLTWHRKLYDTLGLYGVSARDAADDRTIWLGGTGSKLLPVGGQGEAVRHEPPALPAGAA